MYRHRIIPCLLRHKNGLYKTQNFKSPKYLGDPLNIAKLFNEKEVDELFVIDIDTTRSSAEPDYDFIDRIASECFMPVCYGGGVRTIEQMKKIFSLGIEKIALSSGIIDNPALLQEAATIFGKQSIVAVVDVKSTFLRKHGVCTHNGTIKVKTPLLALAKDFERLGAGEIVINNVDHDGEMNGYDLSLMKQVADAVDIPVVALGGAGKLEDMVEVIQKTGCSAAAAGSLFVYSGVHRAVLVNYPSRDKIDEAFLLPKDL
jgi:cyclase